MRENPFKSPEAEGTSPSRTAGPIAEFVRLVLSAFTVTVFAVFLLAIAIGSWPFDGELQFVLCAAALIVAIVAGFKLLSDD